MSQQFQDHYIVWTGGGLNSIHVPAGATLFAFWQEQLWKMKAGIHREWVKCRTSATEDKKPTQTNKPRMTFKRIATKVKKKVTARGKKA